MIPIQRFDMLSFESHEPRQQQCCYAIAGKAYWTETWPVKMLLRYYSGPVSWDLNFICQVLGSRVERSEGAISVRHPI
jgi:hypothetical protein